MIYELKCIYNARESFYGKATVEVDEKNNRVLLHSYSTHVATYFPDKKEIEVLNPFSQTTKRHIREFAKQYGIEIKKIECGIYKK